MGELEPRARLVVARCPTPGERAILSREEIAHARARRVCAGDEVILVDGTGIEARGRLVRLTRGNAEVVVEALVPTPQGGPPIDLFVAGLRLERLAWIAEKATELAAARLILVQTARTQSFRASSSAISRLTRVVREAAKQCESSRWPRVFGPVPLHEALASAPGATRIFLDLKGERFPQTLAGPAALLVGPEGGWTEAEAAAARQARWIPAVLPAGKLRGETAAVVALALTRAALERDAGERGMA